VNPVRIDLYSDTKSRPTPGMRRAMAEAEVGDEQSWEDPTVNRLCERVCELLSKEAAIEANAQDVEPLEEVPEGQAGARFFTDLADLDAVTKSLREAGWSVTASEMGYIPKDPIDLPPDRRKEVEEFLEAIDDQDDVHRIYTALR